MLAPFSIRVTGNIGQEILDTDGNVVASDHRFVGGPGDRKAVDRE